MRIVELGIINDATEELIHENNISPFFPHSNGFVQINCHALDAGLIAVETSSDGASWDTVRSNVLPIEPSDRSFTVPYNEMNRYIKVSGQVVVSVKAEVSLIGS